MKKWAWTITALILISSSPAQAADDSSWDRFVHSIGKAVYFAAFPTATYRGVNLETIRQGTNGTDVVFVVYGISAFSKGDLRTEVIVTVKDSTVVDLRWGANNAILSPPGRTLKSLGNLLKDLNNQSQASRIQSSTVRMTWVLSNRCGYSSGLQVRFFDVTKSLVWPNEDRFFTLARGETREIGIDTYSGDRVCIGAAPNVASPASYWGVGPSNEHSCKDCCYSANNGKVSWLITCP